MPSPPIPRAILGYGLAGLIPFLAPAGLALWSPAHAGFLAPFVLVYGALILSFLGGARWGLAAATPAPGFATVSLAMLPTLAALALLVTPGLARPTQLQALAVLLLLHFAWDWRSRGLPGWYPRLRALLTAGAVLGLLVMAAVVARAAAIPDATMV